MCNRIFLKASRITARELYISGIDIFGLPEGLPLNKLIVKWIAPTYVRGQSGSDTATVFHVR